MGPLAVRASRDNGNQTSGPGTATGRVVAPLQRMQHLADAMARTSPAGQMQTLADARTLQRARNSWTGSEERQIGNVLAQAGHGADAATKADTLLGSSVEVFRYGREPATDEQVEITGGASYLKKRKADWAAELGKRQTQQAPTQTSWEKYQQAVGSQLTDRPSDPWFLNTAYGYNAVKQDNIQWIQGARAKLDTPDPDDPQQLLGKTYDRDTSMTSRSSWATGNRISLGTNTRAGDLAGKAGWIFRIFDNAKMMEAGNELRLRLSATGESGNTGRFEVTGTVVPTQHFPNRMIAPGTEVRCRQISADGVSLYTVNGVNETFVATWLLSGWSGQLEAQSYYDAVTVAEDSLGIRFQSRDPLKARNRSHGRALNDAAVEELKARYENGPSGGADLSLEHSLGPARNPLNIEDLDWGIAIAQYRRLGGDLIFAEAPHAAPHMANYSSDIAPAGQVDVTNPDWYYDSQKDRPDRFVGGRSNSTFLYLKTASALFSQQQLTVQECLDVMAFVVADMVVSGEHSLPECMTTVVMAAENSPPWNGEAINIAQPLAALKTWLLLVDDGTRNDMRATARDSLIQILGSGLNDFKLLKVLTILGRALDGH